MNETRRHFDFQQPHSMFGTWLGVVLLFVVFGLFVWVVLGAIPRGDSYEEKRAKSRMEKLEQLQKDSTAALTSYAWVDKNKGTVRIPVERAMELVATDLASKKPMAAYPIATPAAEASAPPTGAANPASAPTGTQPGAAATPAASPPSGAAQPNPAGKPVPTPVQSRAGSPLPVAGKTPTP